MLLAQYMGKHKTTKVICENCYGFFQARNSDIKKGWGLFCSARCKNNGANNPNYKGGKLSNYEYKMKAKLKNPQRFAAMQIVQTALRNGSLIRMPCIVCGNTKSEAHHIDYSKPLDVKWLCRYHHIEEHQTMPDCKHSYRDDSTVCEKCGS